jgi:hypothetical protein
LLEKPSRQKPIDALSRWGTTDIRSRPDKIVELGRDDPGPLAIEPKPALGCGGNLNAIFALSRSRVRDGQNVEPNRAVLFVPCHDNAAGAILQTLFLTAARFVPPQIGIANNLAWLRRPLGHESS